MFDLLPSRRFFSSMRQPILHSPVATLLHEEQSCASLTGASVPPLVNIEARAATTPRATNEATHIRMNCISTVLFNGLQSYKISMIGRKKRIKKMICGITAPKWLSMKSLCLWAEIHSKAIVFNSFNSLDSFNSKTCESWIIILKNDKRLAHWAKISNFAGQKYVKWRKRHSFFL